MKCLIVIAILAVSLSSATLSATLDCKTPCTKTQCAKTTCVTADPYSCVGGSASGGCATNPNWFANTTSCTDCCDVSGCALTCAPCSQEECRSSTCTAADPFVCTAGKDANGCAPSGSAWSINPGCSACCDLSQCPTLAPTVPPTVAPVVKLNCKKSCGDMCKNARTCSTATPFMCTAGNSTYGCLVKDDWTEPSCTDCCDVSMCPQTPCGTCPSSVCKNTQCNYLNPYICTSGTLSGGCSGSKSFWPSNPDCDKCCYLSTC